LGRQAARREAVRSGLGKKTTRLDASQLGPFLSRVLPGATPAPHPGFAPCEPKLRRTPRTGERWLSEIKHDGYRVQAHLEAGPPKLFTRRGYDWTPRFAALASALTDLPANNIILDGEVIVQGETGVGRLRRAAGRSRLGPLRAHGSRSTCSTSTGSICGRRR
jgi:bifunctional non-homologous end joining protein LigD